jgi:hypothetical protein
VIGDVAFQQMVHVKAQNNRITLARYKREGISLEELSKSLSVEMKIDNALMHYPSKKTVYADARKIFCHLARAVGFPTLDIGNFLGIQQAAVSHAARKGAALAAKLSINVGGEDVLV